MSIEHPSGRVVLLAWWFEVGNPRAGGRMYETFLLDSEIELRIYRIHYRP